MYRKILEIGPIPPPRAGWGVRIDYVMKAMSAGGIDCAALDLGLNRLSPRPAGSNVHGVKGSLDYAVQVLLHLARGYRIHNHLNSESWKAYCLVLYASITSLFFFRPAVLTWHGGLGGRWFPNPNNRLIDLVHWIIYHLHAQIICNDDKVKEHIVAYGIREDKVVSIPAFSRQYVEFEPAQLPEDVDRFLGDHDPVVFSYVFFRPEFYLDVLLDGIAKIRQTHPKLGLLLVGCSEGNDDCIRKLKQLGIEDDVHFVGDLQRDPFLTLLSRVDLCIRTPKQDGVSSSVLEALSLGVPVVAAHNSMRPPQVTTYTVDDPDDLARASLSVLAMEPESRRPAPPEIRDTVADEIAILVGQSEPLRGAFE